MSHDLTDTRDAVAVGDALGRLKLAAMSHDLTDTRDAVAVGDALGKLDAAGSARQVADRLAAHGHRGVPVSSATCPVAAYLHASTGLRVAVDAEAWAVLSLKGGVGPVPAAVSEFIYLFDRYAFPELIAS